MIHKDYLRSSVFGFEDALVSTTGVVIGISTGTSNIKFIVLASLVTIAVEAVSMGAGQFLSERTLHEADKRKHRDSLLMGSVIMFFSYFFGGLIPIFPIFLLPLPLAIFPILFLAFLSLFILGYVKGLIVEISPTRSALEMLFVGGLATIIGVIAGYFLRV
ncbi:MAG TPA: hypothetical protein DCX25_00180 [Candidatus Pacebacteria bacterium]|nr:MAG: hypothetical protein UX00_C0003G0022 [Microgenomates group bacterium GW2011_GWB1_45_17]KKU24172.1 MAG: hypothetical protein UX36_C0002G0155 [Microgenomates group bacterium GW2011_GWC1_46_15]KKU24887.1 MAG: hypothetical protein UX35_C0001G0069 [Microgenomates group bacterium GW2011_GWA1_46_15]HAV14738.1 hypothetical protein [Candidatus Paceibacterota bacterium]HCR92713.1 hypothetical protein [Candidatus Paceibacterota bacterium]